MTDEYQPREHDHLIEPLIQAVHGEPAESCDSAQDAPGSTSQRTLWLMRWAGLVVPISGFALALLVWGAYRLFNWLDLSRAFNP